MRLPDESARFAASGLADDGGSERERGATIVAGILLRHEWSADTSFNPDDIVKDVRVNDRTTTGVRLTSLSGLRSYLARLGEASVTTCGAWTAGQIYCHLAAGFEVTCEPPADRAPWHMRFSKLPQRFYVLNFGFPRGVPIPAELRERLDPPPDVDRGEQLARLQRAVEAFDAKTADFPAHPVLGPFSRRQWCRLHLRHCELHLAQISVSSD
jgi:hypothetical protein